jgi:uncharacterized protein (DUF433 family)
VEQGIILFWKVIASVINCTAATNSNCKKRRYMSTANNLASRITVNPKIMLGKPIVRNMRITVEQILYALSGGVSEQELMEEYPELETEDFQAVFAYVARLVEEEQVFPLNIAA